VFINYSGRWGLQPFHGKAIVLDIKDRHAPFPYLFIIHEMRVRGFHPFMPIQPSMPDGILWQDWILDDGVFDSTANSFRRDSPPESAPSQQLPQSQSPTNAGGASSGRYDMALNEDIIEKILAATRAMPSWKACQLEGTSWAGMAEENTQKYVSVIGVEERSLEASSSA
jgi:hypothetical protein